MRLPTSAPSVLIPAFMLFSSLPAAAQATSAVARVTQPVDMENLVILRGTVHPLARPENDRGAAPDSLPMERMLLVLQRGPEQEASLRHLLDEQQTKSSPHYHQWLLPEQFGEQFGPAPSDLQAVTDWLTAQGFQVIRVGAGRTVIEFSGTAGLLRQVLHTEIHKYEVMGKEHWANANNPQIPAALAPVVAGITSLNNFPRRPMYRRLGTFSRSKATAEVQPLFTFTFLGAGTFYAVGPSDFANIYNVMPLWQAGMDGAGQSLAIVAQTNINLKDVVDFRTMFGLPANVPQVILNGPDPGITMDEGEADLDVQWAGAVARSATILLVVSQTTETTAGIDLSALYIVDNNLAPVMSESYGGCEAFLGVGGNAFYYNLWEQAAAQGITVLLPAGDSGSAGCDDPTTETVAQYGLAVSGLASTPFNVAVGGTDFDDLNNWSKYWNATNSSPSQSSAKSYIPETTWNDSCAAAGTTTSCTSAPTSLLNIVAAGGGPSSCGILTGTDPNATCVMGYPKPSWQTGPGVSNDGVRDLPDVSLFAGAGRNSSFYVFCQADTNRTNTSSCDLKAPYTDFQAAGGTSFATPAFAGMMALVNQKTGQRQGNANYVLYKLAAQNGASCASNAAAVTNSACVFYDVVTGNNSVACDKNKPNCSNTPSTTFGVLVSPSGASTLAWTTGAGYDLATGLGSVNAANLVNKWSSVSFTPSATTLSISPTTLTHGQSASVNIGVTSSSGTPTGAVSLLGGPNGSALGIDSFTLVNGNVSGATDRLPGGTYEVTAHYAGDGNFGASDSAPPVQVTVSKESSLTKLALETFDPATGVIDNPNAATTQYGFPYVLRVDVTNSSAQPCSTNPVPCPTGQVNLTDNGSPPPDMGSPPNSNPPGTYVLNSYGYTEDQFIQFPPGSHSVVAAYAGDNSYQASTSPSDAITITKATTTTLCTPSASSVPVGSSVTLTASVSTFSTGVAPTGTVQFLNGSTPLSGTVTYQPTNGSLAGFATLQATLTVTLTSSASITAQYGGDANYLNSASTPAAITVTDFSLAAIPASFNIVSPGQSGSSNITLTPVNGFTGMVSFSCTVPSNMTGAKCALNPTSLVNGGTITLSVTTRAPSTAQVLPDGPGWFVPAGGALWACMLLLLSIPGARRRWKCALGLFCLAWLAAALMGCGGGGGGGGGMTVPGTPAGTYTITVTGTSSGVSHSANVSVTVQ